MYEAVVYELAFEKRASQFNVSYAADRMCELYLSLAILPGEEDPYSWWRSNRLQFPYLAKLAQKYVSAPASSVPSEKLFSGAGQIFSSKRGSLKWEKGKMLLLLKYNMPLLDFEY